MERLCIRYDRLAKGSTLTYGIEVIYSEEIQIDFSEAIKRADEKIYKDKAAKKAMRKGKPSP